MSAGAAKAAGAALCIIKFLARLPLNLLMTGYDHLGDTLSVLNHKWLFGKVHKNNLDFSAIIGINGTGRIQYGNAFLGGKTAAGANLGLIAFRKCDVQAGRDQGSLEGFQYYRLIQIGPQIKACRQRSRILRKSVTRLVYYLNFHIINYLGAILYNTTAIPA